MPFDGSNHRRLVRQISEANYSEPPVRSGASDLIRRLLTVEPQERATIKDVCSDPWINQGRFDQTLLQVAEDMSKLTPVRLDLLLALSPNNLDKMTHAEKNSSPASSISSPQQQERCTQPNAEADCEIRDSHKNEIEKCSTTLEACISSLPRSLTKEKQLEDGCLLNHEEATPDKACLGNDCENIDPDHQRAKEAEEHVINIDAKLSSKDHVGDKENEDPNEETFSTTHSIIKTFESEQHIQTNNKQESLEKSSSNFENKEKLPSVDLLEESKLLQEEINNLKTLSNLFPEITIQEENKSIEEVHADNKVAEVTETKPIRRLGLKKNSKLKLSQVLGPDHAKSDKSQINEVLDQLSEDMKRFLESNELVENPENPNSSKAAEETEPKGNAQNENKIGIVTENIIEKINNFEQNEVKHGQNHDDSNSHILLNDLTNLQNQSFEKKGQALKSKIPIKSKDPKVSNSDRKGSFDREAIKIINSPKVFERKFSSEKERSLKSLKMNDVKKSNENISNRIPRPYERRNSSDAEKSSKLCKPLERKNSNDVDPKKLQNFIKTNGEKHPKTLKTLERKGSHENGINKSPSPSKTFLKKSASENNRSQRASSKPLARKESAENVSTNTQPARNISFKRENDSNGCESKDIESLSDNEVKEKQIIIKTLEDIVNIASEMSKDQAASNTIENTESTKVSQENLIVKMEASSNQVVTKEINSGISQNQISEKTKAEEKKETAINILKRKIMLECKSPPPKPVTTIKKPGKISIPKFLNSNEETSKSHQSQKETIILSRRVSDAKKEIETKIEERRRSSVVIVRRPSLAVERLRKRSAPSTIITEEMLERGEFIEDEIEEYEDCMHDSEEYHDSLNEHDKDHENTNKDNNDEDIDIIKEISNTAEILKENTKDSTDVLDKNCDDSKDLNREGLNITKEEEIKQNLATDIMTEKDDEDYKESLKVLEECINQICKNTLCDMTKVEHSNLENEGTTEDKESRRESLQSNYETPPEFNVKNSDKLTEDLSNLDAMDAEIAKWAELFQTDLKRLSPEGASEDASSSTYCSKSEKKNSSSHATANAKNLNGDLCFIDISGDSSESTGNESNFKGKKSLNKLEKSKNELSTDRDLSDDEFDIHFDDSQPIMYGSQSLWNFLKAINEDLTNHLKMIKMATQKSTKYLRSLSTDQKQEKSSEEVEYDDNNDDAQSVRSTPAYHHSISLDSRYRPSRRPIWDENKWEEEFSKLSNPDNLYPSVYATTRRPAHYLDRYRAVSHSPNRDQTWSDDPALDDAKKYLKPSHRRYSRYGDNDSRHHYRNDRSRSLCRRYYNDYESSPEDYSWTSSLKRKPSRHDSKYQYDSKEYDRLSKFERRKSYRESTKNFDASNLYLDQLDAEDAQVKSQIESEKLDVNKILEELDKDSLLEKLKTKGYENMVSQRLNKTEDLSQATHLVVDDNDMALQGPSNESNGNFADSAANKVDEMAAREEAVIKSTEASLIKNKIFPNPKYYTTTISRRRKSADCFLRERRESDEEKVSKSQIMLMETKRILNKTLKSMNHYEDLLPGSEEAMEEVNQDHDAPRGDESVSERIWRKSFYSRFNDQQGRRRRSTYRDSDMWDSCLSLADLEPRARPWKSSDMPTCDSGIASTSHRSLSRCSLQDDDQTV